MEIHNQCISSQPSSPDVLDSALHGSNGNMQFDASSAAGCGPLAPTPREEPSTSVRIPDPHGSRALNADSDADSMDDRCQRVRCASARGFSRPPILRSPALSLGQSQHMKAKQQIPMARRPNPNSADVRSGGSQSSSGHDASAGHSSPRRGEPVQVLDGRAPASRSNVSKRPEAAPLVNSPRLAPEEARQLQAEAQMLIASYRHSGLDDGKSSGTPSSTCRDHSAGHTSLRGGELIQALGRSSCATRPLQLSKVTNEVYEPEDITLVRSPALTPEECRHLQAEMQLLLRAGQLEQFPRQ